MSGDVATNSDAERVVTFRFRVRELWLALSALGMLVGLIVAGVLLYSSDVQRIDELEGSDARHAARFESLELELRELRLETTRTNASLLRALALVREDLGEIRGQLGNTTARERRE